MTGSTSGVHHRDPAAPGLSPVPREPGPKEEQGADREPVPESSEPPKDERTDGEAAPEDRAEQVEEWFTAPVIIAAVASVPAMFLTTMEGTAETVGSAMNLVTMVVFIAETVVLLALSGDRLNWLRKNRVVVGITLASIPAVIFALGPVQVLRLLRLVRVIGALRILRVRRIVKAGRVLRRRAGLTGWAWRATSFLLSLAAAAFVAFVLADPSSTSRQTIDAALGRFGFLATLLAGGILGVATYIVARSRRSPPSEATADEDTRPEPARSTHDS